MKEKEKEYLLRIINLQQGMLEAYAQKNMNKFLMLNKELDEQKKASYEVYMQTREENRKKILSRFDNLLTELKAVVKDL